MLASGGMNSQAEALKARTKKFALDVLAFLDAVPPTGSNRRIVWQLSDSGTSVGANYRAACRSRSDAEFAAKIGQVLEETDESLFWLEICEARSLGERITRARLLREADELTAIFAASSNTIRAKLEHAKSANQKINLKSEI